MKTIDQSYSVYTDGSCKPNPGIGGFAAVVIREGEVVMDIAGSDKDTTNNRMELQAVILAVRVLPKGCYASIISDSKYVINTINKGWQRNANKDLWDILDKEMKEGNQSLIFLWVKGHADNKYNNRVDELAQKAADDLKNKLKRKENK